MRSTKQMEMFLRNGKIKIEPPDSNDDHEPVLKSRYITRHSVNRLQKIKIEPDDDYVDETYKPMPLANDRVLRVRQPKPKVPNRSDESDYSDECDDDESDSYLKYKRMSNLVEPSVAIENENVDKQKHRPRPNQTAPAQIIAIPTIDCDEKRTYSCHLCGKTFQHLCRLKTHMPAHTNKRRFQCAWCCKRYKSASSMNVHKNHCHLGKPRKSRTKSITSKRSISEYVVVTPKIKLENECKRFVEVKMEPYDDENDVMDVSLELDPLEIREHVPFVWDKCDTNLLVPNESNFIDKKLLEMETDQKEEKMKIATEVNTSFDQMECINSSILKVNDKENSPLIITSPIVKPSKFEIWQKETADPLALHVDILRMPKFKRILFPPELDASQPAPNETMTTGNTTDYNKKSTELTTSSRVFGDLEFMLKNWDCARQWYNRSLCHAEQKTYHFSTAYAKRAQCFFKERMYQSCWTDLMLAQSSGLPDVLLPVLERHKRSCKFMIMKQVMQANQPAPSSSTVTTVQPTLSSAANPMFPEMACTLQIDWNEYNGRHIRARQPISVGQILIIETGFVASTTSYYEKCCICLTADTNLVPCSRCARALLCKNCVNGWFHQIECELQMSLNLNEHLWIGKVIRSFLNAINLFLNVDEMMKFVHDAISSCNEMPAAPIVDRKSKYRAFLQLIVAPTIQPEMIPIVARLQTVLLNHPAIGSCFKSIKYHRFLAHLLIHHICVINMFTAKVGSSVCENGFTEIVAPITSHLKHSCAPNVSKFLLGQSIIVVAMRPIEPGEQLCVSYCDILKATIDRQYSLQMEYGFQCTCERCQTMIVDQQIQTFHCDEAEKFAKQNFNYLASNDQFKRKQLNDCVVGVLQQFGRMPWNYTIGWAYAVYSLLLSHRFQKKLLY